jgi:Na+-transporting NADH:ubiquinone oxidoreductase subunit NqrC
MLYPSLLVYSSWIISMVFLQDIIHFDLILISTQLFADATLDAMSCASCTCLGVRSSYKKKHAKYRVSWHFSGFWMGINEV